MDLLLLLLYTAFCVTCFKVFKIPLNKWTVPTAILGGVAFVGTIVFVMNFSHPYGKYAKEVYASVPIVPAVRGIVTEVHAEPNQEVEKGAILFQIDPTPFQAQVDELHAKLEFAKVRVEQSRALEEMEAGSLYELQAFEAQVAELEAKVREAQFNLDSTTVRAPSRGVVTQMGLRPGVLTANLPFRPAMVFVPTEKRQIIASFWQNALSNLHEGDIAEVVFDALPGRVFTGEVKTILPYIAEAEYQFSGSLTSSDMLKHADRPIAIIELTDDLDQYELPIGLQGKVAVIQSHDPLHVGMVRRVLLRMAGWLNYVYPVK
ncbi:HlyD family secretion protein [Pelagicoccus mobilis]|uniref:HlyD family secretion protein n=1 Tax=Pelagicoccus mobilis TaxID=415221 RepID=A0A934RZR7_9BACT|nr:efflux RND transporter periplasmic adaptor subunit [Pelagicoccus mobilis]MBK1879298.1 HlyD family secretion protein [Pelagicoccus mobilis]